MSMLTGLKVSSLPCKCAFYRPEHNEKMELHGNEVWMYWSTEIEYTND